MTAEREITDFERGHTEGFDTAINLALTALVDEMDGVPEDGREWSALEDAMVRVKHRARGHGWTG